jgi:hypothetical protein
MASLALGARAGIAELAPVLLGRGPCGGGGAEPGGAGADLKRALGLAGE